ncbi:2'-5'-RNA ligase [Enhygromyxa salina]|uniref:RNA 2',3'-cyclic phosphodiesterase n=1 Tax=Enhygromyxa salina TaxID=215803 RepID=A0A2S9XAK6_9BACT|nr:RNA 2',3'-cyclic phosphodiesterase [Enhygromyxa salina]PRP89879.1 2'-5'-RNA ligase [Enhygromyxa salina]
MPRLFLGIDLPDEVKLDLQMMSCGIPDARWQQPEQLHLTLHFLGEVDGGDARRSSAALEQLDAPAFDMQLRGAGLFPPRGQPRILWVGVAAPEPVRLVHQRCARILDELGAEREHRKYAPHVTLARFAKTVDPRRVAQWVRGHSLYASASFRVDHVRLYSSVLSQGGPKYRTEAIYPLSG